MRKKTKMKTGRIFENVAFGNLIPTELEIGGEWSFELPFQPELAKRPLSL